MLKTADVYIAFEAKSKLDYVENKGRKSIIKENQKYSFSDSAL